MTIDATSCAPNPPPDRRRWTADEVANLTQRVGLFIGPPHAPVEPTRIARVAEQGRQRRTAGEPFGIDDFAARALRLEGGGHVGDELIRAAGDRSLGTVGDLIGPR